jgi:hypothetical protein
VNILQRRKRGGMKVKDELITLKLRGKREEYLMKKQNYKRQGKE